eukprot:1381153-Pyramimonas_sp.AAC.1
MEVERERKGFDSQSRSISLTASLLKGVEAQGERGGALSCGQSALSHDDGEIAARQVVDASGGFLKAHGWATRDLI